MKAPSRSRPISAPRSSPKAWSSPTSPGYYLPGSHGIRIENLLLVRPAETNTGKPFLRFEDLTLAPYHRALIDTSILRPDEIAWIDAYHARVLDELRPHLAGDAANWLDQACTPLI